jgi:hypothetical protein
VVKNLVFAFILGVEKKDWMPLLLLQSALFICVQKIAVYKQACHFFRCSKAAKKYFSVRICRFWLTGANLVNFDEKRHIHDCRFEALNPFWSLGVPKRQN